MKIGLPTILTLLFLTLKLCGVIAWGWWWVLAPLWIAAALYVVIFIALLVREIKRH